ncbi:MAG: DUF3373 family protein [Thermodesulfobacteriaceae bacterium]|nr:DUF3373 family protein [Thermodesulfobacteriaceae bacterium]
MKKGRIFFISSLVLGLFVNQGFSANQEELLKKIEDLSKELEALKAQLKELKAKQDTQEEKVSKVEKATKPILESFGQIKLSGDIRTRIDAARATIPSNAFMLGVLPGMSQMLGSNLFGMLYQINNDPNYLFLYANNYTLVTQGDIWNKFEKKTRSHKEDNDSLWTNRLRLDLSIKPTENTIAKVRLAYNKAWGMGDDYFAPHLFFPMKNNFTYGVRPDDSRLYVDRAYFNINYLFGKPIWISFGRRPTTHGVPQEIREGIEKRDATPSAINIDVPFDGATIGYDYDWGRIRFCYGRGFESGFKTPIDRAKDDVEFYGFNWDVYDQDNKFLNFQAFKAQDIFDFPSGDLYMFNPAFGMYMPASMKPRTNLGDLYEIGLTWTHKNITLAGLSDVDYFLSLGMSIAEPKAMGRMDMPFYAFNGTNMMPVNIPVYYTLLNGMSMNPADIKKSTRTGYALYAGIRLPVPQVCGAKLGLEYNYGSKWWMPFHIGSDDPYMNKLSTRGHVAEIYWQQDLPVGERLRKNGRALLRVGFQHYWFNYYGSANWLETPRKIDDIKKWVKSTNMQDQMRAMTMYVPLEKMWNLYGSLEIFF